MSTVIKVEHLSKYYKLGVINSGTFFRDMQTWIARKQGKEDPHSKIGSEHHYDATKKGFWALQDLTFDIKQGDRVGVIGRNGAGKSTILKIMSRITAPTEGSVKIKGRVASLLEVGTGFHGELTGRENIYLNGAILGMKRYEVDRKLDEIIAFSEIDKHIDTPVKRYSSGMFVKLAFAVAAHLDSEILIADEVLAVGDQAFQKKALGKMNELSTGEGRTVLFVSHNMASVKNLCKTGVVLEQGKVISIGEINDCIDIYNGVSKITSNKLDLTLENVLDDNYYQLKRYFLCDKNESILENPITDGENVFVKIEGEIKNPDPNLVIFVSLINNEKEILWTNDIYTAGTCTPSALKAGPITIKMKLPMEYFHSGKYSVSVSSVIHHKKWDYPPHSSEITFIYEKNYSQHPVYTVENFPMTGRERNDFFDIAMPIDIQMGKKLD